MGTGTGGETVDDAVRSSCLHALLPDLTPTIQRLRIKHHTSHNKRAAHLGLLIGEDEAGELEDALLGFAGVATLPVEEELGQNLRTLPGISRCMTGTLHLQAGGNQAGTRTKASRPHLESVVGISFFDGVQRDAIHDRRDVFQRLACLHTESDFHRPCSTQSGEIERMTKAGRGETYRLPF